jgi:hypothetical protein
MPKKTKTYTEFLPACFIPAWIKQAIDLDREAGFSTGHIMRRAIERLHPEAKLFIADVGDLLPATMPSTMIDPFRLNVIQQHQDRRHRTISQAIRDALYNYYENKRPLSARPTE